MKSNLPIELPQQADINNLIHSEWSTIGGYLNWLKEKINTSYSLNQYSDSLIENYGLKFLGIHYKSVIHESKPIISELIGEKNVIKQISLEIETIKRRLIDDIQNPRHLAWIMIKNEFKKDRKFKLGIYDNSSDAHINFPIEVINSLLSKFVICHLDRSIKNFEDSIKNLSTEIKKMFLDLYSDVRLYGGNGDELKLLDFQEDHDKIKYIATVMYYSFYALFTILKKENFSEHIFCAEESTLFNNNNEIYPYFLPVYLGEKYSKGVLVALFDKKLSEDDLESIKKTHLDFFNLLQDFERDIKEKYSEEITWLNEKFDLKALTQPILDQLESWEKTRRDDEYRITDEKWDKAKTDIIINIKKILYRYEQD